jgi:hypothetical protein
MDLWEAGQLASNPKDPGAQMYRGRVLQLGELSELTIGDIQAFYRHEVTQAQNEIREEDGSQNGPD